ncbi:MAG TPA: hypothetical protein VGM88_19000 [Kofleriaceae bacterium]
MSAPVIETYAASLSSTHVPSCAHASDGQSASAVQARQAPASQTGEVVGQSVGARHSTQVPASQSGEAGKLAQSASVVQALQVWAATSQTEAVVGQPWSASQT